MAWGGEQQIGDWEGLLGLEHSEPRSLAAELGHWLEIHKEVLPSVALLERSLIVSGRRRLNPRGWHSAGPWAFLQGSLSYPLYARPFG